MQYIHSQFFRKKKRKMQRPFKKRCLFIYGPKVKENKKENKINLF